MLFAKWTPTFTQSQLMLCWIGDWCRDGNNQGELQTPKPISKAFLFQAISCSSSTGSLPWFYHYWAAIWWCLCMAGPHQRGDLQLWSTRSDIQRKGTIDNGAVHGTRAVSPSSIPSIMFNALYSALKRLFYPAQFNWYICFSAIFLFSKWTSGLTDISGSKGSWVTFILKQCYKAYPMLQHRLSNTFLLPITLTKAVVSLGSSCPLFSSAKGPLSYTFMA